MNGYGGGISLWPFVTHGDGAVDLLVRDSDSNDKFTPYRRVEHCASIEVIGSNGRQSSSAKLSEGVREVLPTRREHDLMIRRTLHPEMIFSCNSSTNVAME